MGCTAAKAFASSLLKHSPVSAAGDIPSARCDSPRFSREVRVRVLVMTSLDWFSHFFQSKKNKKKGARLRGGGAIGH